MKNDEEIIINLEDFVNARNKEIETIEESIKNKRKITLKWQTVPHYKRRRNHSYIYKKKKFKQRSKQRFGMRSHVYFAKRFHMLMIDSSLKLAIPWIRNVKSKSFLNKAYNIGFFIEESFREIKIVNNNNNDNNQIDNLECMCTQDGEIFRNNNIVYHITGNITKVVTNCIFKLYLVNMTNINKIMEILQQYEVILYKNNDKTDFFNSYIIIGNKYITMKLIVDLQKIYVRLISIKELEILALEYDIMTFYDKVNTPIYQKIDAEQYKQIKDKYERTPIGKKNQYNIEKQLLYFDSSTISYYIFKIPKGTGERGAEIVTDDLLVVGRVIRVGYKRTNGVNYGLLYFFNCHNNYTNNTLYIRSLGKNVWYKIELIKSYK